MKLNQFHEGKFQLLEDKETGETYLRLETDPIDKEPGFYMWIPEGWCQPDKSFEELHIAFDQATKEPFTDERQES